MPENPRSLHRQPLDSLATQIILFVFLSTFATALVVSWISIQSTNAYLSGMVDRQYPAFGPHICWCIAAPPAETVMINRCLRKESY